MPSLASQDESAFAELFDRHRRELQVHCYRMLGSFEDSEDLMQETFLRAWRGRERFEGRSAFRTWLYRIATNACLDVLGRRPRTAVAGGGSFEVSWLQPYPDSLLEGVADEAAEPEEAVVERETIELAFMVAIQHLPPRQRAVLIVRDVLDWSAKETAALLDISVPAANSALQRAREALRRHLPERRLEWSSGERGSEAERALLERFMDASERADAGALVELLADDALFAMPPEPGKMTGAREIVDAWISGGLGSEEFRDWRGIQFGVNRQPAVAWYLRKPGEEGHSAFAIDVLRIEDGRITEVMAFPLAGLAEGFGLPKRL